MIRYWHMLKLIPRYPSRIAVAEIAEQLADVGFVVTRRTIER
jgi:hypothetical protein